MHGFHGLLAFEQASAGETTILEDDFRIAKGLVPDKDSPEQPEHPRSLACHPL